MDFFKFLKNSTDANETKISSKITRTKATPKIDIKKRTNDKTSLTTTKNDDITLYKNIKRGDFVKIIYIKDSLLNSYKGYIGEIRDYKKDQEYALVFLHAISSQTVIKFPLQHFYKIDI
jgi:hypothetical protein